MPLTTEIQKQNMEKLRTALIEAGLQYMIKDNNGNVLSVNVWIGE